MIDLLAVAIWVFSLLVVLKYMYEKNKKSRVDKMISDIPNLTTGELKE